MKDLMLWVRVVMRTSEMKIWRRRLASLRTQTYFRLSLVPPKITVCEPEPENDFCDATAFVFSLANQIA